MPVWILVTSLLYLLWFTQVSFPLMFLFIHFARLFPHFCTFSSLPLDDYWSTWLPISRSNFQFLQGCMFVQHHGNFCHRIQKESHTGFHFSQFREGKSISFISTVASHFFIFLNFTGLFINFGFGMFNWL